MPIELNRHVAGLALPAGPALPLAMHAAYAGGRRIRRSREKLRNASGDNVRAQPPTGIC
jgi:hypothetical protein